MKAYNKRKKRKNFFKPQYNKFGIFDLLYQKTLCTFSYSCWSDETIKEYEKKREKIGFKIKKLYKFENIFMNRIRKKYDKYYNKEDHNFKYKD